MLMTELESERISVEISASVMSIFVLRNFPNITRMYAVHMIYPVNVFIKIRADLTNVLIQ